MTKDLKDGVLIQIKPDRVSVEAIAEEWARVVQIMFQLSSTMT
jgi:hypothetical protein